MEISYWQSRWRKNNTGWHMDDVYPPLPQIWEQASFKADATVLVPLCGKSMDLHWLADHAQHVIGVEVSQKALQQVIQKHPEHFSKDTSHGFTVYRSQSMELWEGDFLTLPTSEIPPPDVIYDKAAIVALPPDVRAEYAQKLIDCCGENTQILLQTFEYKQDEMNGPPFSVEEDEIRQHFAKEFSLRLMYEQSKFNKLRKFQQRGLSSYLREKIFLLEPL
jgi:thiopurine S-methyltransferase